MYTSLCLKQNKLENNFRNTSSVDQGIQRFQSGKRQKPEVGNMCNVYNKTGKCKFAFYIEAGYCARVGGVYIYAVKFPKLGT